MFSTFCMGPSLQKGWITELELLINATLKETPKIGIKDPWINLLNLKLRWINNQSVEGKFLLPSYLSIGVKE